MHLRALGGMFPYIDTKLGLTYCPNRLVFAYISWRLAGAKNEMAGPGADTQIPALVPGREMDPVGKEQPEADAVARKLYEATAPSVVRVRTEKGVGTGFFLDSKGTLATDAHVVIDSSEQFAVTPDGQRRRFKLDRLDELNDLAILKPLVPFESKPLQLGSSTTLMPDDLLYAIGNPKGVSSVYVSPGLYTGHNTYLDVLKKNSRRHGDAIERALAIVKDPDLNQFYNSNKIAADMHIEHGSSGSPVLDKSGKVIGVADLLLRTRQSFMTPIENLTSLQSAPPKFRMNYHYAPDEWVESYLNHWTTTPLSTAMGTGVVLGLGAVGLSGLRRFPKVGGTLATIEGVSMLHSDYNSYSRLVDATSTDDWKYGLAMTADGTIALGGLALMALRKKTYGLSTIAAGVLGRMATDFIPNRYALDSIERTDGSKRRIIGRDGDD